MSSGNQSGLYPTEMVEFAPHQYINRKVGEALGIIKKEVRETDAAPSIRSLENSDVRGVTEN